MRQDNENKNENENENEGEAYISPLEQALDSCLKQAIEISEAAKELHARVAGRFPNLQPAGPTGCGKTAIIKSWAKKNNIHLYNINLSCLSDDELKVFLSGEKVCDFLNMPRTVLFIEHYEMKTETTEKLLAELIDRHVYTFNGKDEFLPELLFTIAEVTT